VPQPDRHVPPGALFSSVDCIRYITINGSDAIRGFEAQMRSLGLWPRITTQLETPDPAGKTAGAFLSHQRAWAAGLAGGCSNLMVLEEDTFFDVRSMSPAAEYTNAFVDVHHDEYDMLLLGWGPSFLHTSHDGAARLSAAVPGGPTVPCVYQIHHWLLMQAYIISPAAMRQYVRLTYNATPIDTLLEMQYDRGRMFTVYPTFAFQGDHSLRSNAYVSSGKTVEKKKGAYHNVLDAMEAVPADEHFIEDQIYQLSGIHPPRDCLGASLLASPEPLVAFPQLSNISRSGLPLFPHLRYPTA